MVCECPEDTAVSCVHTDNADAASRAVSHLIDSGHTNIGMITLLPQFPTAATRLNGFLNALSKAGITVPESNIVYSSFEYIDGYEGCKKLMEQDNPPTAIFCYNDVLAIGAVRYLVEHGLTPGKDVDIIGFDDIPFSEVYMPSISSIRQPCFEMGKKAFELLLDRINNPEAPTQEIVLPSKLILRNTTRQ